MNLPDINLYHLYISVPTGYKEGKPISFQQKSIGQILDEQEFFDLVTLEEWITTQFMNHVGWNLDKPVTTEVMAKVFEDFVVLGICPVNCCYIEDETQEKEKEE